MSPKKKSTKTKAVEVGEFSEHFETMREILENTQSNIRRALELLKEKNVDPSSLLDSLKRVKTASQGLANGDDESNGSERVIEGVFNGHKMVGPDGIEYNVPANYASKSKLVEGDILKLTITGDGSFIYKQIGPIERKQLVATLAQDDENDWFAAQPGSQWRLLTASVTYFHGSPGDEVVILIPKDGKSSWAAVENIIKVNHG